MEIEGMSVKEMLINCFIMCLFVAILSVGTFLVTGGN